MKTLALSKIYHEPNIFKPLQITVKRLPKTWRTAMVLEISARWKLRILEEKGAKGMKKKCSVLRRRLNCP